MNVINIISDQHMADCLGSEGHPQAITPNLDQLATQGVRFSHAYTQNPICTPSRVSVLSGQYCHNHGFYGLSGPAPEHLPSFLQHFRTQGYRTAAIGKLHTPDDPEDWLHDHCDFLAECYDYDREARGLSRQPTAYEAYLDELGLTDKEDSLALREFGKSGGQAMDARPSNLPYEHSVEGWAVREAMKFIENGGDKPFCVQVSLPKPHQCYTPAKPFWDMYPEDLDLPDGFSDEVEHRPHHFRKIVEVFRQREGLFEPKGYEHVARRIWRGYLGCISQVDHAVGELLNYLDQSGKADDTMIIYHADHGAYSGTYGLLEKAPGICSERVCRVPFIWRVPGAASGKLCEQFVENVDVAPTLAALCRLPPMDTVDGRDLSGLLNGREEAVREVAVTENVWSKSLRWGKWRFVHYQPDMFKGEDVGELYDMEADTMERNNLYDDADHRAVVDQCRRLLLEWLIDTTRCVTVWPGVGEIGLIYSHSADGKEPNTAGAAKRLAEGNLNYI